MAAPRARDAVTTSPKNLVVAGAAGVGKTTLVKEAAWPWRERIGGFWTESIMEAGARVGFRLRTFDGQEALLASKSLASTARLNKYGVDLDVLERIGVAALQRSLAEGRLTVIDEIGAMGSLSASFRETCLACLSSEAPVLATIRLRTKGFEEPVRRLAQTAVVELRRGSYEAVRTEVRAWLAHQIDRP